MRWKHLLRRVRTPKDEWLFDATRSVTIGGPIDDGLAVTATPRILELKADPEKPLVVLIDSPGGRLDRTGQLLEALFLENRPGERCPVFAVATGHAMSAAADLLVAADFAAALPACRILCHGGRTFEQELTEGASVEHGANLNYLNAAAAKWLARHIFRRNLDTYRRVEPQFPALGPAGTRYDDVVASEWSSEVVDIRRLASAIWSKLPDGLANVVDEAVASMAMVSAVRRAISAGDMSGGVDAIVTHEDADRRDDLRHRFAVLSALLSLRMQSDPEFELDFLALTDVASDLAYYVEATSGNFEDEALFLTTENAEIFFGASDLEVATKIAERGDEQPAADIARFDAILERAYARAAPLWAFSLGVARLFQRTEIELDAESAWWLGLIDHVLGTDFDRRLPSDAGPQFGSAE
jgi:ATP-dependent protease ClpP protease subunit